MIDENDTTTTDLLRTVTTELESDKAGRAEFTVAELDRIDILLSGIKPPVEDTPAPSAPLFSATAKAAFALYDAVSAAANAAMADLIATVEEQADDIRELRADLEDRDQMADGVRLDAIWTEIEDSVSETAAEAARQVIRDELIISTDLI